MEVFEKYKWFILAGFACIGLAFGVVAHDIFFGTIIGIGIGLLAIAFIAGVIKVNFKQ